MEIGVSTHIHVYSPLDERLLRKIAQAGFKTVEVFANHPHWPDYDQVASRRRVAEACGDLGLRINSVHTPFFRRIEDARAGRWLSLTARDPCIRRECVQRAVESIALAEFAPVACAVIHMGESQEIESEAALDRLYYGLEEILEATAGYGVALALENITNSISRGRQVSAFIEQSGLENLGACYDCGHAAIYGRTTEELLEMAPHLLTTHIHDTSDGLDNHLLPFRGDIDWRELSRALLKADYHDALIIESKDDGGSDEALREAYSAGLRLLEMVAELKPTDS